MAELRTVQKEDSCIVRLHPGKTNRMTNGWQGFRAIACFPGKAEIREGFKAMSERALRTEAVPIAVELLRRAYLVLDRDACAAKREIQRVLDLLVDSTIQAPFDRITGLAPWQARKVIDHVLANLGMPIRVEDLANVARLSTSHFSRAFRRSFHTSPHAYITALRVVRARTLLLEGDERMSQIAMACGFADQAHFCRAFHRKVGCAPGVWRRARRDQPIESPASSIPALRDMEVPVIPGTSVFGQ